MLATMMYVAHSDPMGCYTPYEPSLLRHQHHQDEALAVEALKQMLRKTHPKYVHFSLIDLRKITTPPVQIPIEYAHPKATGTLVGGRVTPLTRQMWMRRQYERPHTLSTIKEGDEDGMSCS